MGAGNSPSRTRHAFVTRSCQVTLMKYGSSLAGRHLRSSRSGRAYCLSSRERRLTDLTHEHDVSDDGSASHGHTGLLRKPSCTYNESSTTHHRRDTPALSTPP